MTAEFDWLISVDDHLVEPPNLWTSRLPKKYRDEGPRLLKIDGLDTWVYEETRMPFNGIWAPAGKPKDDWSMDPVNYDEMHPSCYDPMERLKIMDVAGILVQTNMPTYPRLCGQLFLKAEDKDLALLCVQAWNDFILDEWCAAAPGRFIPIAMLPLWSSKLAAQEAERAIGKGARGLIFSDQIADLGQPSLHDEDNYWDPLLQVANDSGLPICMHISSGSAHPTTAVDAPTVVSFAIAPMNALRTMYDWMFSGHFFRYPMLRIVLNEGGIGWMPYALHWLDHTVDVQRWSWKKDYTLSTKVGVTSDWRWTANDFGHQQLRRKVVDPECPPSVLFKDHVFGVFIDDPVGVDNIDRIGVDNVMIGTDYPHTDTSWPESIKIAQKQLFPLNNDEITRKVLTGNASRLFQFTPARPPTARTVQ
jgi:predicted TIM-barrel fold metal-dependent hydrolase